MEEALAVNSLDMLRAAVQLCLDHNMPYLPILQRAREAIAHINQNRAVLTLLSEELSRCTSIAALIRKHDILSLLAREATTRGFHHDVKVAEATSRLHKVRNLLDLRQRMRAALEVCSPTRMQRAIEERRKLVRMFGDDFLLEEATALDNLAAMLVMQQTLLQGEEEEEAAAAEHKHRRMNMHELFATMTGGTPFDPNQPLSSATEADSEASDLVYLPRFVRDPLLRMRNAPSQRELSLAMADFVKVVPAPEQRKFYLRAFKWTVAFAFWLRESEEMAAVHRALGLGEGDGASPMAAMPATTLRESTQSTGSPVRSPSVTSHSVYSASTGRRKHRAPRPTELGLAASSSSPSPGTPSTPTAAIPFSQRQAKSDVAAREMIKRGKKVLLSPLFTPSVYR